MVAAIDICLVAIVIICVWSGYKKGLVMGVGGMVSIILSLYVACLLSSTYSYEIVPVLKPFASGYVEGQVVDAVMLDMGINESNLSMSDVMYGDTSVMTELAYKSYLTLGIYDTTAEQMADEAVQYAIINDEDIVDSIIEVLCARVTYVGGVILFFLLILTILTALGNIPNLAFKLPNMDKLNDASGAIMGLIQGLSFCLLLTWSLKFFGLIIGKTTLSETLIARIFVAVDIISNGVGI